MWSIIPRKASQNSLFSWLLTIFTAWGHWIIENMMLHCCLIRAGGKIFLGLNLVLLHLNYMLLVSLGWNCRGLCKQIVIERSNQCNFHNFFFSFKEKGKSRQGWWLCAEKKKNWNCVGFVGRILPKKHQLRIHGNVQSRYHQKSILLGKEDDISLLRSEMN